jgi:hypothetical protein
VTDRNAFRFKKSNLGRYSHTQLSYSPKIEIGHGIVTSISYGCRHTDIAYDISQYENFIDHFENY